MFFNRVVESWKGFNCFATNTGLSLNVHPGLMVELTDHILFDSGISVNLIYNERQMNFHYASSSQRKTITGDLQIFQPRIRFHAGVLVRL